MDVEIIASNMRAQVEEMAKDSPHTPQTALTGYADALEPFLKPQDQKEAMLQELLVRVAALAADGECADAGHAIDAALVEEEAASVHCKVRLLQSGVEVARLDGDVVRVAEFLVQQNDLEAGGEIAQSKTQTPPHQQQRA